jgi:membrane-associated phospholipid phosphatase
MPPAERHAPSLSPRGLAILGWGALALAGWLFFTIAWDVASHARLVVLDARVAAWLHAHGHPALTTLMLAVSQMNSVAGISIMTLILAAVLARRREWYWLSSVLLSVLGGLALNSLLKQAYQRARPHFDDPLVSLASFSFPSGHTAGATAFYGVLAAYLVSRHFEPRRRIAIIAIAILAVVLVAFSRMYLGAHYLSDVAAAAASSTAWLALCLSAVHALLKSPLRRDAA